MNEVRPYYLIGRRQLARVAEQVRIGLSDFAGRWWPLPETSNIERIEVFDADNLMMEDSARYLLRHGADWIACMGDDSVWQTLAQGWLGCSVAGETALIKHMQRAFCVDLFKTIATNVANPVLLEQVGGTQLPMASMRRGDAVLVLHVNFGGVTLPLLANADLWHFLAEHAPSAAPAHLIQCATALAPTQVRIRATLPAVQLPLSAVMDLRTGDFLDLGHDLSGRVRLQGENIDCSLSATLGRNNHYKAVVLDTAQ